MPQKLEHRQIYGAITALGRAKIVNLDASLQTLLDPLAEALTQGGVSGEVSLHILCCDEYAIVTGLQAASMIDVERVAGLVRGALGDVQQRG